MAQGKGSQVTDTATLDVLAEGVDRLGTMLAKLNRRMDTLDTRLGVIEDPQVRAMIAPKTAPTPAGRASKAARPVANVTVIPTSAALNALQGACGLSAQMNVHRHAKRGIVDMREYVSKLAGFQNSTPGSARFQYAVAVLDAMHNGQPTVVASKGKTRKASRQSAPGVASTKPFVASALPPVGTKLTGKYKGKAHKVTITAKGARYGGQTYSNLTAIARLITGGSVNGPRFFGLRNGQ